jgi:DNA-binding transcriptional MocR family regulator
VGARARGQGTFVAEQAPAAPQGPAPTPRFEWTGHLSKAAQIVAADARRRGAYSQMARTASGVISFAGGMPDSTLFPTDAFRRVLNRVIARKGASSSSTTRRAAIHPSASTCPAISSASASRRGRRTSSS